MLPAPTPDDLIVFYLPEANEWQNACFLMLDAGFVEATPFNPYWRQRGRTLEDPDRYRTVLAERFLEQPWNVHRPPVDLQRCHRCVWLNAGWPSVDGPNRRALSGSAAHAE